MSNCFRCTNWAVLMCAALGLVGCGNNDSLGLASVSLEVDLYVVEVQAPAQVEAANVWELDVVVGNAGGIDARGFELAVEIRYLGALVSTGSYLVEEGLSAGDVVVVPIPMSSFVQGGDVFTGVVTVDSRDSVLESDETNNQATFNVTAITGGGTEPIPIPVGVKADG